MTNDKVEFKVRHIEAPPVDDEGKSLNEIVEIGHQIKRKLGSEADIIGRNLADTASVRISTDQDGIFVIAEGEELEGWLVTSKKNETSGMVFLVDVNNAGEPTTTLLQAERYQDTLSAARLLDALYGAFPDAREPSADEYSHVAPEAE